MSHTRVFTPVSGLDRRLTSEHLTLRANASPLPADASPLAFILAMCALRASLSSSCESSASSAVVVDGTGESMCSTMWSRAGYPRPINESKRIDDEARRDVTYL